MTDSRRLDDAFTAALNADLAALGCGLWIAAAGQDTVLLVDRDGRELGQLPEHIDASIIAAFEIILVKLEAERRPPRDAVAWSREAPRRSGPATSAASGAPEQQ